MIGIGWPNGGTDNERIYALTKRLLLLSSEHWHVKEAQEHGNKVVYRIVPPLGQRPAKLKWDVSKYIAMVLEQTRNLPLTDIIWANELDLQDERGDSEDDFQNLEERYTRIAKFGTSVIARLRTLYPGVKIHWPAFTPNADHGAIDHVDLWRSAAELCDVIDFHAYDTLQKISGEHALYMREFPHHELALTEFHGKGDQEQEGLIFDYLENTELENYFFIYEWFNYPGWWSTDYDIANNPSRIVAIYERNIDSIPTPIPEPTHEPLPEPIIKDNMQGVDVASWQGYPDWAEASLGLSFAFTKATGGVAYRNPTFEYNWKGIGENGLHRGAYHYAYPDDNDPISEAKFFLSVVQPVLQEQDMLALDMEESGSDLTEWILAFLDYVKEQTGITPLLYTGSWFLNEHGINNPRLAEFPLWLAAYSNVQPPTPKPWKSTYIWQYSSTGKIPGIQGDVDLNVLNPLKDEIVLVARQYGPDVPSDIENQRNDWSCSVRSLYASLWAMWTADDLPFEPTYGDDGPNDVYNWMVPNYANSTVGLLDSSGTGIVSLLSQHGIGAYNINPVNLEQAQEVAGIKPAMLGSRGWFGSGHWVYLKGISENGTLQLENPATNAWNGIFEEIRDSFNAPEFGSWSMVVLEPQPQPKTQPTDIPYLMNLVGNAYNEDGVVRGALQGLVDNPNLDVNTAKREITNVINWLEANKP